MTSFRKRWIVAVCLLVLGTTGGAAWWRGRYHRRLEACLSCLSSVLQSSTPAYVESQGRTYATSFRNDENPIMEGGGWVNAGNCGNAARCRGAGGSNVRTIAGLAFGTQPGALPPPYNDSAALVTGDWGSDQFVQVVVWWNGASGTNSDYDEVEIRLRGTLAKDWCRGYNINCRVGTASSNSYIQMGRFNGPPDDFTPPFAELHGPSAACQNGDVLTGTVVGNIITAYINGRRVIQAIDSAITSGSPGLGFYRAGTHAQNYDFGISGFIASDRFPQIASEDREGAGPILPRKPLIRGTP